MAWIFTYGAKSSSRRIFAISVDAIGNNNNKYGLVEADNTLDIPTTALLTRYLSNYCSFLAHARTAAHKAEQRREPSQVVALH